MPSNHISNEPYHEWLRERATITKEDGNGHEVTIPAQENEAYQVVVLPSKNGRGWEMKVTRGDMDGLDEAPSMVAQSDDDLPVVLRKLYGFLNNRQGEPLAD